MTAKYQMFRQTRSTLKEGREEKFYPRIVRNRTVDLDEISQRISASSTFTTSDVVGVWDALKYEIIEELRDGNRVQLDGLGHFFVTLKCREVTDPKEIRAESIRFSKVSFIPAKELHRKVRSMSVTKDENTPATPIHSQEHRMDRILHYLRQEATITSIVCMRINYCSRKTAQKDLKALHEAGKIIRHGAPNVSIYSLKPGTV